MVHKIMKGETQKNLLSAAKKEMRKFHKPKTEGVQLGPEKQAQLDNKLLNAAGRGNNEEIQRLLKAGADINHKNMHGRTALMYAARTGQSETCKFLIEKGADI
ncbi:MAG: ankyrin repeat domain-containing protein, partial [Candidatus Micrarchaeota archaeon]|nr:ankyrin repeat domain-containing protein [Candidatus Micrarchaeota archaeon]